MHTFLAWIDLNGSECSRPFLNGVCMMSHLKTKQHKHFDLMKDDIGKDLQCTHLLMYLTVFMKFKIGCGG